MTIPCEPSATTSALAEVARADLFYRQAAISADEAAHARVVAMADAYRAGATLAQIGDEVGISHSAVHHALRRAGLEASSLRGSRSR